MKVIEALTNLNLPSGVTIDVKIVCCLLYLFSVGVYVSRRNPKFTPLISAKETAMESAQKRTPDISAGSTFLFQLDDNHYPIQVKVLAEEGDGFRVSISIPRSPKICDQCGHGLNLSQNAITGVVVCMTTGCGKDFGYRLTKTTTMKATDFIPV